MNYKIYRYLRFLDFPLIFSNKILMSKSSMRSNFLEDFPVTSFLVYTLHFLFFKDQ